MKGGIRRALATAGVLTLFVLAALPAQASSGELVAPARIDLAIKPGDSTLERDLSVTNRGSSRDTFSLSMVDVVVHDGLPEALPVGATPYSAAGVTTIVPASVTLDPGKSGTVKVTFDVSAHAPFLGALRVVPGEPGQATAASGAAAVGISVTPAALVLVSAAPVDATGELLPVVNLGVDPVRLDLPAFLESGPIVAHSTVRDSGTFFERLTADYTFAAFGHPFLTVSGVPADALPAQTASTGATTRQRLEVSGQTVDAAPWVCVCQVTVRTYAQLAGRQTLVPVTQTAYVVIFPWRAAGALLCLLALLIVARRVVRGRQPARWLVSKVVSK